MNAVGLLFQQAEFDKKSIIQHKQEILQKNALLFEDILNDMNKGGVQDNEEFHFQFSPKGPHPMAGLINNLDQKLFFGQLTSGQFNGVELSRSTPKGPLSNITELKLKAIDLLSNITAEEDTTEDIVEIAPTILKLLQQWVTLQKNVETEFENKSSINDAANMELNLEQDLDSINLSVVIDQITNQLTKLLEEKNTDTDFQNQLPKINYLLQQMIENVNKIHQSKQFVTSGVSRAQVVELKSKIESLMSNMSMYQKLMDLSPKLLEIIKQWEGLQSSEIIVQDANHQKVKKEQIIWRDLVQAFQKRSQFAAKEPYHSNAGVTSKDVTKWISKLVEMQANTEKGAGQQQVTTFSSSYMPKLEQYVIHVNYSQNSPTTDQQIMEQFQKVISSSRFLTLPNGANQLSIAFRPENLGEMIVRLTQINGEMTVKIIVSSHMARDMLESNIHQLKNMFAPHQVVIERQDLNSGQQSQDYQKEQEEQLSDSSQNGSGQSEQENQQQSEKNFEEQLETILMNEKV